MTATQAAAVAAHLDAAVRALAHDGVGLVASIGVATFGSPGEPADAESVLGAAHPAMYASKAAGRAPRT